MGILAAFVENLPRPPKKRERESNTSINVVRVLFDLTLMQQLQFWCAWLAWTCDALDFFSTSLAVPRLETYFHKEAGTVTTSITLTLLFRPLGALIFGLLSDRYGRKWPMVADLVLCSVMTLASGFVHTFSQFLAVRCLFGITMGGIWGLAASNALENMPIHCRGMYSGILQQGYACGYLIIAVINLSVVPKYNTWRVLYFVAAAFSIGAAGLRVLLPESQYFIERRNAEKAAGTVMSSMEKSKIFVREAGKALKLHWIRCIFAVCLMTGFNFFSHGSQDLYPTYAQKQKGLSSHSATVATIIGNVGAVVGGTFAGWLSQRLGRRLTIIGCCIWTCVWLPLWYLPNKFGPLAAGAFFVQSGVQGAWGVIPIYLTELSPRAYRGVWPGVAYQIGNMVSAASSQIESTAGENIKTKKGLPDYGKVSIILIAVVAGWIIGCSLIGKEDHGAHFEHAKAAYEADGGLDIMDENDVADKNPHLNVENEKGDQTKYEHETNEVMDSVDQKEAAIKHGEA